MELVLKITVDGERIRDGGDIANALRQVANCLEPRTLAGLPGCESHIYKDAIKVGKWRIKTVLSDYESKP